MSKLNLFIYTLILILIIGFIVFYYTLSNVCADELQASCTPTPSLIYPIPTESVVPDVSSTPTSICLQQGDEDVQIACPTPTSPDSPTPEKPTNTPPSQMQRAPTAGQSATPYPQPSNQPTWPAGTSFGS